MTYNDFLSNMQTSLERNNIAITKKAIEATLKIFCEEALFTLKQGDSLTLTNFGRFNAVRRTAQKGYNFHTGKNIDIPACKTIVFKPAKYAKAAVNGEV